MHLRGSCGRGCCSSTVLKRDNLFGRAERGLCWGPALEEEQGVSLARQRCGLAVGKGIWQQQQLLT